MNVKQKGPSSFEFGPLRFSNPAACYSPGRRPYWSIGAGELGFTSAGLYFLLKPLRKLIRAIVVASVYADRPAGLKRPAPAGVYAC